MYRVVKHEHLPRRPRWMISLLLLLHPSYYGKHQTEHQAQVMLRYIRLCIHKTRLINGKKRVQIESSPNEIVIKNNYGKKYLTFNVEKTKS